MIFLFPSLAGYAVAVGIILAISFALGVAGYFQIKGDAANYFVAGNSLPMWMVAIVRINQGACSSCVLCSAFSKFGPAACAQRQSYGTYARLPLDYIAQPFLTHIHLLFLYFLFFKSILVCPPQSNDRLWLPPPSTQMLYWVM
jgi:hypothetical protein